MNMFPMNAQRQVPGAGGQILAALLAGGPDQAPMPSSAQAPLPPRPNGLGAQIMQAVQGAQPAPLPAPVPKARWVAGNPSGRGAELAAIVGGLAPDGTPAASDDEAGRFVQAAEGESVPHAARPLTPTLDNLGMGSAVRAALDPMGPKKKKGFDWELALGIFTDALAGATGRPAVYAPMMERRRAQEREDVRWQTERADRRAEAEARRQELQFTNVPGVGYVAVNPMDLTSQVVTAARSPSEVYAEALGYAPGTDEYADALQDFVLKGYGPTGEEDREDRQAHALATLQERIAAQRRLAEFRKPAPRPARAAPRPTKSTVIGGILEKQARGGSLSPAESRVLSEHGGSGADRYPDGTVIEMPDGSVKTRRGGRWVNGE